MLKEAAQRLPEETSLVVCDPQGMDNKRLQNHLLTIEPRLIEMSASYDDVGIAVATVDKSRQSAINKLGAKDGAGDMAMQAYWDVVEKAASLVGRIDREALRLSLIRISPISDEGITIFAGRGIPKDIGARFARALKIAKKQADLTRYTYAFEIPYGEREGFELDLDSFSKVLRHPEMVVACRFSISSPRGIRIDEEQGFILDEVRNLDNDEISFYGRLPETFRVSDKGLAEVETPFQTSLMKEGVGRVGSGVFVEIKLKASEKDAQALLRFTKDGHGWRGTKKGYMEIFSQLFGMRGFNTFIGKARTNSVLSPIAQGINDLEATTLPVGGSYLQYWAQMQNGRITQEMIRNAIKARLDSSGLDFEPSVMLLDADCLDISEARSGFILKSLGREGLPGTSLELSDFMLNFIENVHPLVQERIILRANAEDRMHISASDRKMIGRLRAVCQIRRTIRDTEDIAWVLRRDGTLPSDIATKAGDLEQWLFDFSSEKGARMLVMLAEEIYRISKGRTAIARP